MKDFLKAATSLRAGGATTSTGRLETAAQAALRVVLGGVLLTHGLPKLLRLPHGTMGDPFVAATHLIAATVGPALATPLAWAVTLLETAGAAMLAGGLFTRLVAAAFVAEMVGIAFALGPAWAWIDRGIEYPVVLGALAAWFGVRGGGGWSVDALLARRR